jgi:hypothetical protein
MFCDGCGMALQAGQSFCSRCGKECAGVQMAGYPRRSRVQEHVRLVAILLVRILGAQRAGWRDPVRTGEYAVRSSA